MYQNHSLALLKQRREHIRDWLDERAPYTEVDQRHLDADTAERAYWHHGYQAALADVIGMLLSSDKSDSADIPN